MQALMMEGQPAGRGNPVCDPSIGRDRGGFYWGFIQYEEFRRVWVRQLGGNERPVDNWGSDLCLVVFLVVSRHLKIRRPLPDKAYQA